MKDNKVIKNIRGVLNYIITVITWSLLCLLVLVAIVFIMYTIDVKKSNNKNSIPMFSAYTIISGSMTPNIDVYDVIIARRVKMEELEKDDIISFRSTDAKFNGAIVTHRIVEIVDQENGVFRTMGDANNTVDTALTSKENVLGKVAFRIPKLGMIQSFIATKGGWLIFILIPCLAIISYDIVKIGKMAKNKSVKKISDIKEKRNNKNNGK